MRNIAAAGEDEIIGIGDGGSNAFELETVFVLKMILIWIILKFLESIVYVLIINLDANHVLVD
jgi:hypothetical protein